MTPYFLHTFLIESGCDPDLQQLISTIGRAGKYVVHAIRHEQLGLAGTVNVQGEEQLTLDVMADQIFYRHLQESNLVAQIASEEQGELVELMGPTGKFSVAFDPLDGSSLLDSNLAVGSIFGVYRGNGFLGKTGRQMVAAGYILYGPRTTLVCSIGNGVHEFILNDLGEFQALRENIQISPQAKIFAPGNLRATQDFPKYKALVNQLMTEKFTLRYSGGMVPDINTIFAKKQGVFTYPASSEYPEGKLRLLYECAPMAFLVTAAGGSAVTEKGEEILDLSISDLHERTTILTGSRDTVATLVEALQ